MLIKGYLSAMQEGLFCTCTIDGEKETVLKMFNASRGRKVFVMRNQKSRGKQTEFIQLIDDTFVEWRVLL